MATQDPRATDWSIQQRWEGSPADERADADDAAIPGEQEVTPEQSPRGNRVDEFSMAALRKFGPEAAEGAHNWAERQVPLHWMGARLPTFPGGFQ